MIANKHTHVGRLYQVLVMAIIIMVGREVDEVDCILVLNTH
jgi:hypothetical protein